MTNPMMRSPVVTKTSHYHSKIIMSFSKYVAFTTNNGIKSYSSSR